MAPRTADAQPANLTTEQLAERWHTSVANIHAKNSRGLTPPRFRSGKQVLYRLVDVEAFEVEHLISA